MSYMRWFLSQETFCDAKVAFFDDDRAYDVVANFGYTHNEKLYQDGIKSQNLNNLRLLNIKELVVLAPHSPMGARTRAVKCWLTDRSIC